jgi:hypothetical protein
MRLPLIGAVALAVILPWLLTVIGEHGTAPFRSSSSASNWSLDDAIRRTLAADVFASSLAIPAMVGIVRLVRNRDPFLVLWAPLIFATTPRMGLASGLGVPTAILAAYGLREVADLVAEGLSDERSASWRRRLPTLTRSYAGFPILVSAAVLFYALTLTTNVQWLFTARAPMEQIDRPSRELMAWIRANTPPGSRFVVVTPAQYWFSDRIAEWFPYLTSRASLTTAQGLEWAGPGVFSAKVGEVERIKLVGSVEPALLPAFVQRHYCGADFIALFHESDAPIRQAFARSPAFRPVQATAHNLLVRPVSSGCAPRITKSNSG